HPGQAAACRSRSACRGTWHRAAPLCSGTGQTPRSSPAPPDIGQILYAPSAPTPLPGITQHSDRHNVDRSTIFGDSVIPLRQESATTIRRNTYTERQAETARTNFAQCKKERSEERRVGKEYRNRRWSNH